MSERMIWVVRFIGIIVFLVLMYLLMSLHARLVKMNEDAGRDGKPVASLARDRGLRMVDCAMTAPTTFGDEWHPSLNPHSLRVMMRGTF